MRRRELSQRFSYTEYTILRVRRANGAEFRTRQAALSV